MNFKPLKNKKEYNNTKKEIEKIDKLIEFIDNEIKMSLLARTQHQYFKDIMVAELQDYEHRLQGEYEVKFKEGDG